MVRIIDIEISNARFAGRIAYAFFWSGLTLFFFYYLPTHIGEFVSLLAPRIPQIYVPALQYLGQSFSNSPLPYIGVLIAMLAFVEIIIRGTWVYGVILIVTGLFWIAFDVILFSRGLLFANLIPSSLLQTYQISTQAISLIKWVLVILVSIFVISSIMTITNGARIIVRNRRRSKIVVN